MYSKNGGKAGAHSLAHRCENIGALSYMIVQTYEHSFSRQFKNTRRCDLALGSFNQFGHFPSISFLALLPLEEDGTDGVKVFPNHAEIGLQAYKAFEALMAEREEVCKAVASLNTVRRKGKQNTSIVEVAEDDGVAE
ncbi:hypothetical protein B0H17DRAFT_1136628 [Mycena rosella]|uniref:Uncharacterized protein n=1 Tax=Mycena rosella TaxID=1033263 RepID=A0AAD7GBR1_MYCRO|nr:hypothetical protein B0H17DRAFT_1136628 [Mycena rosella]